MRISVIDNGPPEWASAVADLLLRLQRDFGISSNRAEKIGEVAAEFHLWIGTDVAQLTHDMETAPPSALSRMIVIGPALGYAFGKPRPTQGTVAELLERHRLAGAFAGTALVDWGGAPSFAGPKGLMERFATNAVKAFQSEHYANWFGPREKTMAEFLAAFLGATASPNAASTSTRFSQTELEAELREAPTPLVTIDEDAHWIGLGSIRISKRSAIIDAGAHGPIGDATRLELDRFELGERRGWAIVLVNLGSMSDMFVGWIPESEQGKGSQWVDKLNDEIRSRFAATNESIKSGRLAEWIIFQQGAEYAPDSPWGIETVELSRSGELAYERRRAGELKAAIQGHVEQARVLELHEQLATTDFPTSPHRTFPPGASISIIITHPPFRKMLIHSDDGLKLHGFGDVLRGLGGLCDALRQHDSAVLRAWSFVATHPAVAWKP